MVYLFTDGFADQFGGEKGKKFMRKNMYALLKEMSSLPAIEQERKLSDAFCSWKQNVAQIDDVCVMGFRI